MHLSIEGACCIIEGKPVAFQAVRITIETKRNTVRIETFGLS